MHGPHLSLSPSILAVTAVTTHSLWRFFNAEARQLSANHITIMSKSQKLGIGWLFYPPNKTSINFTSVPKFVIVMFGTVLNTSDAKERSKIHLFTSRYNSRCNINHCKKCLYCYHRSRRREINLVWAGQRRLGKTTEIIEATFLNSAMAVHNMVRPMRNVPQVCCYSADRHQSWKTNALTVE